MCLLSDLLAMVSSSTCDVAKVALLGLILYNHRCAAASNPSSVLVICSPNKMCWLR